MRLLILLLALAACGRVEPAPEDLDGLAHYLWQHRDDEGAEALHLAAEALVEAVGGAAFEGPEDGTLSRLTAEELALVGREDAERGGLYGVLMVHDVACSMEELEFQAYAANQDELHPDTYVSYERSYTSDLDAYLARETEFVTWSTTYAVEGFMMDYSASISGSLRYAGEAEDPELPQPVLALRAVLDAPAHFDGDEARGIFQDYQVEAWAPLDGQRALHLYAIWREMVFTESMDFSDEGVQRIVLDGLADWDEEAEALCAEGS